MKKKSPKKVILYQKYLQETAPVEEPEPVAEHMEYPGMPKEKIIIYEHGDFYEVLRRIGCILMLLFALLLMGCAVVAVVTTLL